MADNKRKRSFNDYLLENETSDDEGFVENSDSGSSDDEDDSINDDTYSKDHSSKHLYPFLISDLCFNFLGVLLLAWFSSLFFFNPKFIFIFFINNFFCKYITQHSTVFMSIFTLTR